MNKKIDSLTGARFLAILIIVFSHFFFLKQYSFGHIYELYFNNAVFGVDFFFMLSGFGMMLSYMNKKNSDETMSIKKLIRYACRHVKKIYPLYIITTLLGVPFYLYSDIYKWGGTTIHAIAGAAAKFCLYLTLLQSATGLSRFNLAFNDPSWFLSTLFCIYLVSPLLLKFIKENIDTERKALILVFLSILCSFLIALVFTKIESVTAFDNLCYSAPYRRVFYVICGMALCRVYCFSKRDLPPWVEYTAVILSMIWFSMSNTVAETLGCYIYIIDMVLCACDLYVIALNKGLFSQFLANKSMVYLGNLAMYIFLIHWLIMKYVNLIFNYFNLQSPVIAVIEVVIILALSLLLSALLYNNSQMKEKVKT